MVLFLMKQPETMGSMAAGQRVSWMWVGSWYTEDGDLEFFYLVTLLPPGVFHTCLSSSSWLPPCPCPNQKQGGKRTGKACSFVLKATSRWCSHPFHIQPSARTQSLSHRQQTGLVWSTGVLLLKGRRREWILVGNRQCFKHTKYIYGYRHI